jgi:UDP-N-acetylmuramoyl-tripeptide--D-alanyl-D-alanine ligase
VLALAARAKPPVMTYGQAEGVDVRLGDVALADGGLAFRLTTGRATADVRLPLAGRHNAWHATAAAAVGLALGVPLDEAAAALALAVPVKGRLVWREVGGVRILDDTYNANPVSVRAALDAFREAPGGGRRWVILGDMLELGTLTATAHREVGTWVAGLPVAGLAAVGSAMHLAAEAARAGGCPDVATFPSPESAAAHVLSRVTRGDRVLVKGSRGMRMERAVDALLAGLGPSGEAPRC